jgi:hypothetical protein
MGKYRFVAFPDRDEVFRVVTEQWSSHHHNNINSFTSTPIPSSLNAVQEFNSAPFEYSYSTYLQPDVDKSRYVLTTPGVNVHDPLFLLYWH